MHVSKDRGHDLGTADEVQVPKLPAAIRTRRLTLRRVRLTDVDDFFGFATEDIWMRLLPEARPPYAPRDAERWVAGRRLANWRTEPTWAIEIDGRMAGWVGLNIETDHGHAELSYALNPQLRGRGLATEAVRAVVDRVFLDTPLGRVWARVDPPNTASVRVLEKLGMRREAVMRRCHVRQGELIDLAVYGLLRTEWTPREPGE